MSKNLSNEEWLASLTGTTKEVAFLLLHNKDLTDEQIAEKAGTTIEYVYKVKSLLRSRGLLPKLEKQEKSTAKQEPLKLTSINDGISPEVANAVYEDFEHKVPQDQIAKKHMLRAPQVLALYKEWVQLKDYGYLTMLFEAFEKDGTRDLVFLGHDMRTRNMHPKQYVPLVKKTADLEGRAADLQSQCQDWEEKIASQTQQFNSLYTRCQRATELADEAESRLNERTEQIKKLEKSTKDLEDKAARAVSMKKQILTDAVGVVLPILKYLAGEMLQNPAYTFKLAFDAFVVTARKNPEEIGKLLRDVNPAMGKSITRLHDQYKEALQLWYGHLLFRLADEAMASYLQSHQFSAFDDDLRHLIGFYR